MRPVPLQNSSVVSEDSIIRKEHDGLFQPENRAAKRAGCLAHRFCQPTLISQDNDERSGKFTIQDSKPRKRSRIVPSRHSPSIGSNSKTTSPASFKKSQQKMARGNQRDKAREKAQKAAGNVVRPPTISLTIPQIVPMLKCHA